MTGTIYEPKDAIEVFQNILVQLTCIIIIVVGVL